MWATSTRRYFGSADNATRPNGAVRLDRHAKYFLMSPSYERAATVGFRCAYDALDGSDRELVTALVVVGVGAVLLCALLAATVHVGRRHSSTRDALAAQELVDDMHEEEDDLRL